MLEQKTNISLNNSKDLLNRFRYILLLLIYKFSYDFVYVNVISKLYFYQNFKSETNLFKYFLLTLFFLFTLYPISRLLSKNQFIGVVMLLFSLLYFIPGLSYLAFNNIEIPYIIYYLSFWLLMLGISFIKFDFYFRPIKPNHAKYFLYTLTLIAISLILIVSWKYTGFRIHFNMLDVYGLRAEERLMQFSVLAQYLLPIFASVIPIFVIYNMVKKNWILVFSLILIQILHFSIGGNKAYIFSLTVAILTYFFFNLKRIYLFIWGFIGLNFMLYIESILRHGNTTIAAFVHYRVQLIPNQISYYIYDFMQSHELLYLKESILTYVGYSSPYSKPFFFIIGKIYYKDDFTQANTGTTGDAYAQFGMLSLLLYPLLTIFVFKLLTILGKKIDERIVFFIMFLYVFNLLNGGFFTVLLTNGFLLTLFVVYLFSSIESKKSTQ